MIDVLKNKKLRWPNQLNQKTLHDRILRAIRNRQGHRPAEADCDTYDTIVASYNVQNASVPTKFLILKGLCAL